MSIRYRFISVARYSRSSIIILKYIATNYNTMDYNLKFRRWGSGIWIVSRTMTIKDCDERRRPMNYLIIIVNNSDD